MLIQPHDPAWADQFQRIQRLLSAALEGLPVGIEHVGSTAVPGLAAKPILDVDLVIADSGRFEDVEERLSALGYFHAGDQGVPGREVFKRRPDAAEHAVLDRYRHHLYACPSDGAELRRHLLFRDRLLSDPAARRAYEEIKFRIAREAVQDRREYARRKEEQARPFILATIAAAERDGADSAP